MLRISLFTASPSLSHDCFRKEFQSLSDFCDSYFKWQWLHCAEVSCRLQKCHRPIQSHTAVTVPLIFDTNLVIIEIWVCACAFSRFHCFLPFITSQQRINSQRVITVFGRQQSLHSERLYVGIQHHSQCYGRDSNCDLSRQKLTVVLISRLQRSHLSHRLTEQHHFLCLMMRLFVAYDWRLYLLRRAPEKWGSWAWLIPFFIKIASLVRPKILLPRPWLSTHAEEHCQLYLLWTRRLWHCAFQNVTALTSRGTWLRDACNSTSKGISC